MGLQESTIRLIGEILQFIQLHPLPLLLVDVCMHRHTTVMVAFLTSLFQYTSSYKAFDSVLHLQLLHKLWNQEENCWLNVLVEKQQCIILSSAQWTTYSYQWGTSYKAPCWPFYSYLHCWLIFLGIVRSYFCFLMILNYL